MVLDPNTLNEAAAPRTLRIPAREIIPQIQPAISVGEVLRMSVRSNNGGQGQLYFRGLLIPAQLPPELNIGDKIFAQVTEADSQLILRILQTNPSELPQPAGQAAPAATPAQALMTSQVGDLLRETLVRLTELRAQASSSALAAPQAAAAEQGFLQATQVLEKAFERITANVATTQTLADPASAHAQLLDSATGNSVQALKLAAVQIRQIADGSTPQNSQRFLNELQNALGDFLEESIKNNYFSKKHLDTLIGGAEQELRGARPTALKEREALQAAIRDLQTAKQQPEAARVQVESATTHLSQALVAAGRQLDKLDPKARYELEQMAARLDQMASAQETLTQLNPLMHALGEPALILFPFLAQGLLNHSELAFESNLDRKNLGGGRDEEELEDVDTTPYQRIQISVPLPEMGTVHVDVAHRNEEMLVRFTVSDPEASAYVSDHLEELGVLLRKQNFTKLEMKTHVGAPEETSLPLPALFRMPKTIVA